MPIDKFGRHFHSARDTSHSNQIFVKVKRVSDLTYEVPLNIPCIHSETTYKFLLTAGKVKHVSKNILSSVQVFLNDVEIMTLDDVVLKFGDKLVIKKQTKEKLFLQMVLQCRLQEGQR